MLSSIHKNHGCVYGGGTRVLYPRRIIFFLISPKIFVEIHINNQYIVHVINNNLKIENLPFFDVLMDFFLSLKCYRKMIEVKCLEIKCSTEKWV